MQPSLKQLYLSIRNPSLQPGVGGDILALLTIFADILVAQILLESGASMALAHIAGFLSAGLLLLLLRISGIDKAPISIAGDSKVSRLFSVIIYLILQLSIRGGIIASLSLAGMTTSLAMTVGILFATFVSSYSSGLFLTHKKNASDWVILAILFSIIIFVLRLVYLGALEVIPQEAYYWNYAQNLSPGYLDHPPMVAATIWSGEFLFGHNAFGTRFGALVYGLIFIWIFYHYARLLVDRTTALFASAFALVLPYFFATGFFMTPDTPLTVAWVLALYFFYRTLVLNEKHSWYGVGLAMGIGMLSKYTIALLAPAALLYIIIDKPSRRILLNKEPYIAALIALLVFSPVIYWNATHHWASFSFHSHDRFEQVAHFFLPMMMTNIMAMVTPLPLLVLPYLFVGRLTAKNTSNTTPFDHRSLLFIRCFLLLPLAVFAWNALKNEPRYNWTGPLWITLLPIMAWLVLNTDKLRWKGISFLLKKVTVVLLILLICVYALVLHYLTLGLPGVGYPRSSARLLGWPQVVRTIDQIQQDLQRQTAEKPAPIIVVGLDKYFIPSKLSYYGTQEYLGIGKKLNVTGLHLMQGNDLMFAYWHPAEKFKGANAILFGRTKSDVRTSYLSPYFESLSPDIKPLPIIKNDFGQADKTVRKYYYRIGYGYKPPLVESSNTQ